MASSQQTSRVEGTILFEDCRIIFRNFAGREGKYNREGDRNFCVLLDEAMARQLAADGWNVKALTAREEGDPDQPYLPVSISYKGRPPTIVLVTRRGRNTLDEEDLELLDWADIKTVDLIVNPYNWAVRDANGVKAYVKKMFVTLHEDELDLKYADLDEIPSRSGRVEE